MGRPNQRPDDQHHPRLAGELRERPRSDRSGLTTGLRWTPRLGGADGIRTLGLD